VINVKTSFHQVRLKNHMFGHHMPASYTDIFTGLGGEGGSVPLDILDIHSTENTGNTGNTGNTDNMENGLDEHIEQNTDENFSTTDDNAKEELS